MKVLFVVQGEGRGHLTQALTLEKMLNRHGHEVVKILVARSKSREVPRFFIDKTKAPIQGFPSPNFLPSKSNQHIGLGRSIAYNMLKAPQYMGSIRFLYHEIRTSGVDLVVNFYEILTGLTNHFLNLRVPMVCIGHQYMFLHPDYQFPEAHKKSQRLLIQFTRATCLGACKLLGLSFHDMHDVEASKLSVVPPLLRDEVSDMPRHHGDYITGYILNAGFSKTVIAWHKKNPMLNLHFFWDKKDASETTRYDETLSFHKIDDQKFLYFLANCKAYATTGGFESVCEAMYMGKPALMVPAHVEQECNAHEAQLNGCGVVAGSFDLDQLIQFSRQYEENIEFRMWENKAELMIVSRLEGAVQQYVNERSKGAVSVGKTMPA